MKLPELQQGCCIRHLLINEVDFEKAPHGITVIDSFLYTFIREIEPVLHEVHAKDYLNTDRFAAALIVIIVWLNYFDSMTPGNDFVHGFQKLLPPGFFPAV